MKQEIKVPSLGESISEASIGQILAPTGTTIKADAEILELETDKVNQALYALQGGTVTLTVKTGDVVKIGQVIGFIESQATSAPENKLEQFTPPKPLTSNPSTAPDLIPTQPPSENPLKSQPITRGIRFGQADFLADINSPAKETQIEKLTLPPKPRQNVENETRRPMSKIRKVIASRMVEAQQTMAMLTTFNEVDLTQVIQLRETHKEAFIKKYGCKLGFMSFFVKATVAALHAFPNFNSYLDGDDIVHREYYNIGVAVGTDKGVIVPVLRNCDHFTFAEIELAIDNFARKAKEGTLAAQDLQGGGFTITNGGTYGSLLSTPILLPPQCGILGMHKIEKRPVVINDEITIRSMMYLALSYDHRLVDGKEAVSFLVAIKNLLEDPARLLFEL